MRDLARCSGPWSGFWIQGKRRGNMSLTLHFLHGSISGAGRDRIGKFSIRGSYEETGHVGFTKVYRWHEVEYAGIWDGALTSGMWTIDYRVFAEMGQFEIWPDREEEEESQATEAEPETLALPAPPSRS